MKAQAAHSLFSETICKAYREPITVKTSVDVN